MSAAAFELDCTSGSNEKFVGAFEKHMTRPWRSLLSVLHRYLLLQQFANRCDRDYRRQAATHVHVQHGAEIKSSVQAEFL